MILRGVRHCLQMFVSKGVLFLLVMASAMLTVGGWSSAEKVACAAEPLRASDVLAKYVGKDDPSYAYRVRREGKIGTVEYVELIMTSQTWRGIEWKHQMFVLNPSARMDPCSHACLYISGGRWRDSYTQEVGENESLPEEVTLLALAAEQMRTPLTILRHVPFQPMFGGKMEDEIIAYTFQQYMETQDGEWPLLLPMVKSAVRAMDTTAAVVKQKWDCELNSFTLTGASKRGWTTWLTGAVDPRASALAPMVIDVLNMPAHMEHQKLAWGGFSEQINDYTELRLHEALATERGKALCRIVDPYCYLDRMQQPKLLLIGTNDRYWPVDSLNLYWDALHGDRNYVLYVPNDGHGLKDMRRVIGSLVAFHQHASGQRELPRLSWNFENGEGKIAMRLQSSEPPTQVQAWTANSETRDFRSAEFVSHTAQKNGSGYEFQLDLPDQGAAALFGEAVFGEGAFPLYLSTNIRVVGPAADPQNVPAAGK